MAQGPIVCTLTGLGLLMAGCATPPVVAGSPALRDASIHPVALLAVAEGGSNKTADTLAAEAAVLARFAAGGPPRYRLLVSYTTLPAGVAVSRAGRTAPLEGGWVAPPAPPRLFARPAQGRVLTVVGLDASDGKVAFHASATEHRPGEAQVALPRLVSALFSAAGPLASDKR